SRCRALPRETATPRLARDRAKISGRASMLERYSSAKIRILMLDCPANGPRQCSEHASMQSKGPLAHDPHPRFGKTNELTERSDFFGPLVDRQVRPVPTIQRHCKLPLAAYIGTVAPKLRSSRATDRTNRRRWSVVHILETA